MYVEDGLQTGEFMIINGTTVKIIGCYLLFYIDCQNNCINRFFLTKFYKNFASANIRTTITTRYLSSVDNTIIVRYLKRDRKFKMYDSNMYPEDGSETSNCSFSLS